MGEVRRRAAVWQTLSVGRGKVDTVVFGLINSSVPCMWKKCAAPSCSVGVYTYNYCLHGHLYVRDCVGELPEKQSVCMCYAHAVDCSRRCTAPLSSAYSPLNDLAGLAKQVAHDVSLEYPDPIQLQFEKVM